MKSRLAAVPAAAVHSARFPDDRRVAADHGNNHVFTAEAEPSAGGPDTGQDIHVSSHHVYLPAGPLPGRTGDLLGVEQHPLYRPAVDHHEAHGS